MLSSMVSIIKHVRVEGARTHGPHPHKARADCQPGSAQPRKVIMPLDGVAFKLQELRLMEVDH